MVGSKNRLLWDQLPDAVRGRVEAIAGDRVVASENQVGGFSPGVASRLRLAHDRWVFAKVVNADWPLEAGFYRSEARFTAHLPDRVPTPRLWGSFDDGGWVGLVFDDIGDGHEPAQPWNSTELDRVLTGVTDLANTVTPSPVAASRDHPRLGGWSELAADNRRVNRLPLISAWAADHLALLIDLERQGLQAARGDSLVHFDLYPHNVLLTRQRVYFVDWPHARLGNPLVDLISILSTVATTGADPSPLAEAHPLAADVDPTTIDALIAAHAGFCVTELVSPATPGHHAIRKAKRILAHAYLTWLAQRRPTAT